MYLKPLSSLPEISYEEIRQSMEGRRLFVNKGSIFPHASVTDTDTLPAYQKPDEEEFEKFTNRYVPDSFEEWINKK